MASSTGRVAAMISGPMPSPGSTTMSACMDVDLVEAMKMEAGGGRGGHAVRKALHARAAAARRRGVRGGAGQPDDFREPSQATVETSGARAPPGAAWGVSSGTGVPGCGYGVSERL